MCAQNTALLVFTSGKAKLWSAESGECLRTLEGHQRLVASAVFSPEGALVLTASLDGNTVEPGVEQMEFAENTLRYQTSLQLLNRRISGLMTAIKGE